jgi:hypothetical protein
MLAVNDAIKMCCDEIPEDINTVPIDFHDLGYFLKPELQPFRLSGQICVGGDIFHQAQGQLIERVDQLEEQLIVVLMAMAEETVEYAL